MLTKDLLRISRAGGGYSPQFAGTEHRELAARVLGIYQGHVGETYGALQSALEDVEREAEDFKLVRGFAKLLERETTFETRAPIPPERAREVVFAAGESRGVVTEDERQRALSAAAADVEADVSVDDLEAALYADLEERQALVAFDARWDPDDLLDQFNLSLAQTTLFDATEVRVRTSDPRALVSAIKRLRLMYEIERTDAGREVIVTGPDALFRATRRYGTRFARLLRTIVTAPEWRLEATIDDRGTERMLVLDQDDPVRVPDVEPVVDVSYDSGVEADFAARFEALDLDWTLTREPEPLAAGARVMIPDFAFDYDHADFRIFFEIMGFWTPEYVEKKLDQLATIEDVDMVVAVDESLGAGEEIEAHDHRAIPYSGRIRVKDVRDVLREYEAELVAESAASLPDEIVPERDVVTLETLAADHGMSESALEDKHFPEHERVGRTLVRPRILDTLREEIDEGMSLDAAETVFGRHGIDDTSAALAAIGYRIEWEGLGGGTVRTRS